jgi:hypothetical protein
MGSAYQNVSSARRSGDYGKSPGIRALAGLDPRPSDMNGIELRASLIVVTVAREFDAQQKRCG